MTNDQRGGADSPLAGPLLPDTPLRAWVRALERTAEIGRDPLLTMPMLIDGWADRFGAAPALLSEEGGLSYRALAERANRYARWAMAQGLGGGDMVCLLMPNCPDYMAIWLGLTRIRAVVALVNSNLADDPLAHAINAVQPRHVIVGADLAEALAAVLPRLASRPECWVHGPAARDFPRIDLAIQGFTGDPLPGSVAPPSITDRALCIYTSGTTGLPKAANVSHYRLMQWSHWFAGMLDTRADDRMYNCLPMYHSIGGVVAPGAVLVSGGAVVLRRRFSAHRFWDDIADEECTLFQYIGELCRYLVDSPRHPREAAHRLRCCSGNGLRAEVWQAFKTRFNIPRILEFYAATEANFSLFNCEGKPGAIGRIPSFLAHRFAVALVKSDIETGELRRDERGFCIRCAANEAGEAVGKVADDKTRPGTRFEGYTDREASEKKLISDVFAKGDRWFRTGDLMRRDESGFFYFVDRLGDTFRWKGENVSTTEVGAVLLSCPGVLDAAVYGVAIPGSEGRAGMAALVTGPNFDIEVLHRHLIEKLPDYARPLFLRITTEIEATPTFKPRKQILSAQGCDPAQTADALYFDDRKSGAFVRLDPILYQRICSGGIRL